MFKNLYEDTASGGTKGGGDAAGAGDAPGGGDAAGGVTDGGGNDGSGTDGGETEGTEKIKSFCIVGVKDLYGLSTDGDLRVLKICKDFVFVFPWHFNTCVVSIQGKGAFEH